VSAVSYNSWLQSSQAGLMLSTMTVKAACLNLQGPLNSEIFRLSFDVYVFDETLRFLEISPPSFFLNFLEHFWGVVRMDFRAIIYSVNKAFRIRSRRTFPNMVFVVRHEVTNLCTNRCWYFIQLSYQFGIGKKKVVLSAVRFNYCANIDCLHFPGNTQILELGSYAHGDEPNLKTSSHCILDMRTIGVEWVECV